MTRPDGDSRCRTAPAPNIASTSPERTSRVFATVPTLGLFAGPQLLPTLGRMLPALECAGRRQRRRWPRRCAWSKPPAALSGCSSTWLAVRCGSRRSDNISLRDVPVEVRLALEMAAHEDTERRAMEGELKLLERQWREAEEVAAIADGLALEHQ